MNKDAVVDFGADAGRGTFFPESQPKHFVVADRAAARSVDESAFLEAGHDHERLGSLSRRPTSEYERTYASGEKRKNGARRKPVSRDNCHWKPPL
jgi:hypothetical protein